MLAWWVFWAWADGGWCPGAAQARRQCRVGAGWVASQQSQMHRFHRDLGVPKALALNLLAMNRLHCRPYLLPRCLPWVLMRRRGRLRPCRCAVATPLQHERSGSLAPITVVEPMLLVGKDAGFGPHEIHGLEMSRLTKLMQALARQLQHAVRGHRWGKTVHFWMRLQTKNASVWLWAGVRTVVSKSCFKSCSYLQASCIFCKSSSLTSWRGRSPRGRISHGRCFKHTNVEMAGL